MNAVCWWSKEQVQKLQKRLKVDPNGTLNKPTWDALEVTLGMVDPKPEPIPTDEYYVKNHILYKGENPVSFKQAPCHGGKIIDHETIVIHYDGANNLGGFNWLCDPRSNVSAHFWISKAGVVWQLLELDTVGWHAGRGEWGDHVNDLNSFSLGIENQGVGDEWPEAQVKANIGVIKALLKAYPGMDVIGHEDYAPGRKSDPGENYPWDRVKKA